MITASKATNNFPDRNFRRWQRAISGTEHAMREIVSWNRSNKYGEKPNQANELHEYDKKGEKSSWQW